MTIYISKKFQAIEILKDENISINFNGCKHVAKNIGIVKS